MTIDLASAAIGAGATVLVGLLTGLSNLVASHTRNKSEERRQIRDLAVKLAIEQWPKEFSENEEFNAKLEAALPISGKSSAMPTPKIIDLVERNIEILNKK